MLIQLNLIHPTSLSGCVCCAISRSPAVDSLYPPPPRPPLVLRLLWRSSRLAGRMCTLWTSTPIKAWDPGPPITPTTSRRGPLAGRPRCVVWHGTQAGRCTFMRREKVVRNIIYSGVPHSSINPREGLGVGPWGGADSIAMVTPLWPVGDCTPEVSGLYCVLYCERTQ